MTNPRAQRAVLARAAAGILSLGLAAAVAGCAGTASADPKPAAGQTAPAKASASPSPVAKSYGDVIGSGKQVKTSDGSYETIALPASSPLYQSAAGPDVFAAGYSKEDAAAAQKLVADYMATEFFDSTALETKDVGLSEWLRQNTGKWFSPEVYSQIEANPAQAGILLGDAGGTKTMPALVHDGKPRVSRLNLELAGVAPYSAQDGKGVECNLTYSATYRVTASAAAAFAASLANETPAQFLASDAAKPKIKAGNEVTYTATGSARVIVDKAASGRWEIIGFKNNADYDVSDFAVPSQPIQ